MNKLYSYYKISESKYFKIDSENGNLFNIPQHLMKTPNYVYVPYLSINIDDVFFGSECVRKDFEEAVRKLSKSHHFSLNSSLITVKTSLSKMMYHSIIANEILISEMCNSDIDLLSYLNNRLAPYYKKNTIECDCGDHVLPNDDRAILEPESCMLASDADFVSHMIAMSVCHTIISNRIVIPDTQIVERIINSKHGMIFQAEGEVNVVTLRKEFKNFIQDKKNCFANELHKLFLGPIEECDRQMKYMISQVADTNNIGKLMSFISKKTEFGKEASRRHKKFMDALFNKNLQKRGINSRERRFEAQGLFNIGIEMPTCIDTLVNFLASEDNGAFFALKQSIDHIVAQCKQYTDNVGTIAKELFQSTLKDQILKVIFGTIISWAMILTATSYTHIALAMAQYCNCFPFNWFSDLMEQAMVFLKSGAMSIIGMFNSNGDRNEQFVAQSGEDINENIITSFVKFLVNIARTKGKDEIKMDDIRINRVFGLSKMINSSKTIYEFLGKLFEYVTDLYNDNVIGFGTVRSAYELIDSRIPKWLDEVALFELRTEEDAIISPFLQMSNFERKKKLLDLSREGSDILERMSIMPGKNERPRRFFEGKVRKLNEFIKACGASLVGLEGKHAPFVIYLKGQPGIGKTLMVDYLLKDMYACFDERYDHKIDKYSKNEESVYWEGYSGQRVYLIDDFLQNINEEVRGTQIASLIQIGSRSPFPLNMATCDAKGAVHFSSEVVALTSNIMPNKNITENYIASHDAFMRRINMMITVKLKRTHANAQNRFDFDGRPAEFDGSAYEFHVEDNQGVGYDCNWEDLVILLALNLRQNRIVQASLDDDLRKTDERWKFLFEETLEKQRQLLQNIEGRERIEAQGIFDRVNDFWNYTNLNQKIEVVSNCFLRPNTSWFNFSFPIRVQLVQEKTEIKEVVNEWQRGDFHLETVLNDPTQVSQELLEKLDTYEVIDELDAVKRKYQVPVLSPSENEDSKIFALFQVGALADSGRLQFRTHKFQRIYEVMREGSNNLDPRFSAAEHRIRDLERIDIGMIRQWMLNPTETLNDGDFSTEHFRLLYFNLKSRINAMVCRERKASKTTMWISSIKRMMKHPVTVLIGGVASAFVAYKVFKSVTKEKMIGEVMPSGDAVTKRVAKKKFKFNRYASEGQDGTEHIHECEDCKQKYSHVHRVNPKRPHFVAAYGCPYEECVSYFGRGNYSHKLNKMNARKVSDEEVEEMQDERDFFEEAEKDPMCKNMMQTSFLNLFSVINTKNGGKMKGVVLGDRVCVAPYHLIYETGVDTELNLEGLSIPNVIIDLNKSRVHLDKERDLFFFELPNSIPAKRKIVDYFVGEDEYKPTYESGYAVQCLSEAIGVKPRCLQMMQLSDVKMERKKSYEVRVNGVCEYFEQVQTYLYLGDTGRGDCGSPIFINDKSSNKKILGIHIAGSTGKGMLTLMPREYLQDVMAKFFVAQMSVEYPEYDNYIFDPLKSLNGNDNIEIVCQLPPELTPQQPIKSEIEPSMIYEKVFDHKTIPALLRAVDGLDPLRNDLKKQFSKEILEHDKVVELAARDLSATYMAYRSPYVNKGVLSWEENVNGIDGDNYINALNFQSSLGFPWSVKYKTKGKALLFDTLENNKRVAKEELIEAFDLLENKVKKGIIPPIFFVDTLKDERRPIEKVKLGKTRIFSCGPIEFNMLVRKYFLNFMAHLMHNHVDGEISVGINPHGDEWKIFYEVLKAKGDHWIAGDYAGYDKKLPYQFCKAAMVAVHDFYQGETPEEALVRDVLAEAMFSGFHVAEGIIYRAHHGMPSGVPITAVFNSIVNCLMFRAAFIRIVHKSNVPIDSCYANVMDMFSQNVSIRAYGDDHILRVNKNCSFFNMISVSEYFSSIGLEYTTTSKGNVTQKYVDDEDLTYLKRNFVYRDTILFGPLDKISINEMTNWIRKSENREAATLSNIEAALLELTHYPRKHWECFYAQLQKACGQAHIKMLATTYDLCFQKLRSGDVDPLRVIGSFDQTPISNEYAAQGDTDQGISIPYRNGSGSLNIGLEVMGMPRDWNVPFRLVANQNCNDKIIFTFLIKHKKDNQYYYTADRNKTKFPRKSSIVMEYSSNSKEFFIFKLGFVKRESIDEKRIPLDCGEKDLLFEHDHTSCGDRYFRFNEGIAKLPERSTLYFEYVECVGCTDIYTLTVGTKTNVLDALRKEFSQMLSRPMPPTPKKADFYFNYVSYYNDIPEFYINKKYRPECTMSWTLNFHPLEKRTKTFYYYTVTYDWNDHHGEVVHGGKEPRHIADVRDVVFHPCDASTTLQWYVPIESVHPTQPNSIIRFIPYYEDDYQTMYRMYSTVSMEAQGDIKSEKSTKDLLNEKEQITQFLDSSQKTLENNVTVCNDMRRLNPYPPSTMESFLTRPYPVYSGTWKTTDIDNIATISFPDVLFKIDPLWDKLRNHRYCRSDIELSIRVNGTQFHYGALIASVSPMPSTGLFVPNGSTLKNKRSCYENMYTAASNNGVIIHPTENEVNKIIIPYVLPKPYIDLVALTSSDETIRKREYFNSEIAALVLWVLCPLRGSKECSNVGYTVFARLKNPDLTGYTYPKNQKKYSELTYPVLKNNTEAQFVKNNMTLYTNTSYDTMEAEGDKEQVEKATRGFSDIAMEAGTDMLAKLVVGAVNSLTAGLNKPEDISNLNQMCIKFENTALSHGVNPGYVLGTSQTNRIKSSPCVMGGDQHDMNFSKIVQRYGLIGTQDIDADTTTVGKSIAAIPVHPMQCPAQAYKSAADSYARNMVLVPTPCAAVASRFSYWRGDITFKMQVIASFCHNARIRIAWHPAFHTADVGVEGESNMINQIIDISTQTEIEFKIPYLNDEPYLPMNQKGYNGVINISLINPIAYPEPTIPKIRLVFWQKGEANMDFALPSLERFYLNRWLLPETGGANKYYCPGGETEKDNVCEAPDNMIYKSQGSYEQVLPGVTAMMDGFMFGEKITHVKDLVCRPTPLCEFAVKKKDLNTLGFFFDPGSETYTPLTDSLPCNFSGGSFNFFKRIFRFWRGSVVVKVIMTTIDEDTLLYFAAVDNSPIYTPGPRCRALYVDTTKILHPFYLLPLGTAIVRNVPNQLISLTLPFFSKYPFVPSSVVYAGAAKEIGMMRGISMRPREMNITVDPKSEYSEEFIMMEAAGDDFEYGYQIGCPGMLCNIKMFNEPEKLQWEGVIKEGAFTIAA
nr:TPA_asm: hypothetical protein [Schmimed virus 2]